MDCMEFKECHIIYDHLRFKIMRTRKVYLYRTIDYICRHFDKKLLPLANPNSIPWNSGFSLTCTNNNHLFKHGDNNNTEIVCKCHRCNTSVSIIICCLYALLIISFDQQVTCPFLSSSTCILHTQPPLRYHNYLLIISPLEVNLSLPVITCYVWLVLLTVL